MQFFITPPPPPNGYIFHDFIDETSLQIVQKSRQKDKLEFKPPTRGLLFLDLKVRSENLVVALSFVLLVLRVPWCGSTNYKGKHIHIHYGFLFHYNHVDDPKQTYSNPLKIQNTDKIATPYLHD
jgi:hypothetical protein